MLAGTLGRAQWAGEHPRDVMIGKDKAETELRETADQLVGF